MKTLELDTGALADIILSTLPADGMPDEWRAGCSSACERIARHMAELLRPYLTGVELEAWQKRATWRDY